MVHKLSLNKAVPKKINMRDVMLLIGYDDFY